MINTFYFISASSLLYYTSLTEAISKNILEITTESGYYNKSQVNQNEWNFQLCFSKMKIFFVLSKLLANNAKKKANIFFKLNTFIGLLKSNIKLGSIFFFFLLLIKYWSLQFVIVIRKIQLIIRQKIINK